MIVVSAQIIRFKTGIGEGNGNTLQYSFLENPHGQRSLTGYSPWGCKELDMTEQLHTQAQLKTVTPCPRALPTGIANTN